MLENTVENRRQALTLLRDGRLDAAETAYGLLLEAAPGDPDLTGLMAAVRLQKGATDEAEALLRACLETEAPARITLRNLHNLSLLLRATGRGPEAGRLALAHAPDWPEDAPAEPAEHAAVRWLVAALLRHDEIGAARTLLDRAMPDRSGDGEALYLDGRLALAEGDPTRAVARLTRARRLRASDPDPAIAACHAFGLTGQRGEAAEIAAHIARNWPVVADPPKPHHLAAIVVTNPVPRLVSDPETTLRRFHFSSNFPKELAFTSRDKYRFISVMANLSQDEFPDSEMLARLPAGDLVLNNMVNPEALRDPAVLALARARAEAPGLPVINHPDAVARLTRPAIAEVLRGVENLRVPRIAAYVRDETPLEAVIADIEHRFAYPLILRHPVAHESGLNALIGKGSGAELVGDRAALTEALDQPGREEFYVVEFIDLKRPDGLYRKVRAGFVGSEIAVNIPALLDHWIVPVGRNHPAGLPFLERNPAVVEECQRIASDPMRELGAPAMQALREVRKRIPLDVFGMDFEVDREGGVVFFEAGATMSFMRHLDLEPVEMRLPEAPFLRLNAAFQDLVARRIAGAA